MCGVMTSLINVSKLIIEGKDISVLFFLTCFPVLFGRHAEAFAVRLVFL